MENIILQWDGEATEEFMLRAEELEQKLADIGLTVELIGSRPKDRG